MYLSNQPASRKHRFRGHFFIVRTRLTAWFDSIDRMNNLKVNRFRGISYAKAQAFFIVSARFMQSFLHRF